MILAHKLILEMPPEPAAGSKTPKHVPRMAAALCLLLLWWLPWLPPLWQMLFPETECPISDPGVGVTNTSRTQIAMLALTALALSGWRPVLGNWRSPGVWIAAFLGWTLLASLTGGDPLESLFFAQGWLAAAAVLLCAPFVLPANPTSLGWRAAVIHGPAIVGGLICLAPMLYAEADYRAAGPFQLPGALATWLILVLPTILVELIESRKKALPLALFSATISVTALALTISRAAWMVAMLELALLILLLAETRPAALLRWAGFGAGGLLLVLVTRHSFSGFGLLGAVAALCMVPVLITLSKKPALVARLLLIIVLAAGLTAAIYPDQSLGSAASKRLSTLTASDDSANGRVQFWKAAVALSLMHPVLGVGPSRFSESYPLVQQYYYYFSDSAHGAIVEGLAEIGWVGVALFATALAMVLRASRLDPWSHPRQRAPLVGLLMGALYSQVEVGYHFAYLWVTGAFLLAQLRTSGPCPPRATGKFPLWVVPALTMLLSAFFLQRAIDNSVRQTEQDATYQQARRVSDLLPFWPKPTLTALAYGLRCKRPLEELDPLVQRALSYAKADSVSYQLAGEIAMQRKRYPQARALFEQALRLDRFNHPGSYSGLLMVASATGDRALADRITSEVLSTYDLEKGWAIAHTGHKQKLALELRPLLYDIADGLSPYQEPKRTEPLYRFLVSTGGEARGLYGLGIALQTQGKAEEGRAFLQQAHDKDPIYPAP